ncbi:unnamed protein product, partial [Peniophora sp. CBMAI 1063]
MLPFVSRAGVLTAHDQVIDALYHYPVVSLGVIVGLTTVCLVRYIRSPWRKLPPGPPGLPLIGNALQIAVQPWFKYSEWREIYGDVIYLNAVGKPIIVLNSRKAATDLLDRRSVIYSDRPKQIVASEMMAAGLFFPLIAYNDTWRAMRKASHEALGKAASRAFQEYQTREALVLARGLIQSSKNMDMQMGRAAASVMLSCLYGESSIASEDDPRARGIIEFVRQLGVAALPGKYWVELLPWMRYIPKRAWLAGTIFAAGSDTTAATMGWWMLAMIAHPDIQQQAQEEIDAVVGRSRPPAFNDMPHLP